MKRIKISEQIVRTHKTDDVPSGSRNPLVEGNIHFVVYLTYQSINLSDKLIHNFHFTTGYVMIYHD